MKKLTESQRYAAGKASAEQWYWNWIPGKPINVIDYYFHGFHDAFNARLLTDTEFAEWYNTNRMDAHDVSIMKFRRVDQSSA